MQMSRVAIDKFSINTFWPHIKNEIPTYSYLQQPPVTAIRYT